MQTGENQSASRDEPEQPDLLQSSTSPEFAKSSEPSVEIEVSTSYPQEVKLDLSGGDEDPSRTHDYKLSWRPTETHIFASSGGKKMCHIGLVRQVVEISGVSLDVAGIGGVLVRSGERRHGYGHAAMEAAEAFVVRKWKTEFMLLFCREVLRPWYDALGWRRVLGATWAEQPSGSIVLPLESMWKSLSGARWPEGDMYLHSWPW